ncbi:MAG: AAA family ATPase [Tumebacillaceae bacterium]
MVVTDAGCQVIEPLHREKKTVLYRGLRLSTEEQVLVKTFHDDFPARKDIMQLKREYEVAQRAASPGVLAPLALEPFQHTWLLMMEDCGGETLEQMLTRGPLDLPLFLEIAIRLADAVMHVHRKNIVHKDLKPANILVNADRGIVKITNFASASLLLGERPEILQPDALEGSLSYISPEQTGRLNRSTDFRSDLYSLGIIFYEMVTGQVPFVTDDPVNLIYQHLTTEPVPPMGVPRPISDVIIKCLAKHAEDRYQSAYGIKHDLEVCLRQLGEQGRIQDFEVGQADRSEHFRLSDVLYGREQELRSLQAAFAGVCSGECQSVFVSGSSGVGKSSLVEELKRIVLQEHGLFVAGKFDQRTQAPYQGILQALEQLIRQLLAESEASITVWREKLYQAVGSRLQVLIEVLPGLKLIVGEQPPLGLLPTWESQNRLQSAIQNLIGVMATRERPLVLFVDDLQWADQASLNLITLLLSECSVTNMLVIGNYRDDEALAQEHVVPMIRNLREKGALLHEIHLQELDGAQVQRLIADTLHGASDECVSLAQAVMERSGGNPFFVKQFLQSLHARGFVHVEESSGEWRWDLDAIRQLEVSSSQVDFMLSKIRELPASVQDVLKAASCLGSSFDLQMLHIGMERDLAELAVDLLRALEEGLLSTKGSDYQWLYVMRDGTQEVEWLDFSRVAFHFPHDRVQQAAYELLSEEERIGTHLKVGRWLTEQNRSGATEDRLFERVNHLNEAVEWIDSPQERRELAALNLEAGQRAKIATGYDQALRYLKLGTRLLTSTSWGSDYELTFALYKERYEVEFLAGYEERAEELFQKMLANARTELDKASAYVVKNNLMQYSDRMDESLRVCEEALRALGFAGKLYMSRMTRWGAYRKWRRLLRSGAAAELVQAPLVEDPHVIAQLEILNMMGHPAYHGDPKLFYSLRLKMVEISLAHGITEKTGIAYVGAAVMVLAEFGDYETANALGRLGIEVEAAWQAKTGKLCYRGLHFFASEIQRWTEHNQASIDSLLKVAEWSLADGDFARAVFSLADRVQRQVYGGLAVDELRLDLQNHLNTFQKGNSEWIHFHVQIIFGYVASLQGETERISSLTHSDFDEQAYCRQVLPAQSWLWQSNYYYCKLFLLYLEGDYASIQEFIRIIPEDVLLAESDFLFLHALTHFAVGSRDRKTIHAYRKRMKKLARICAENFLHKSLLLEAEAARVSGQDRKAMDLYDQAITAASRNGFEHHAAMANECAARFYSGLGKQHLAATYYAAAHYGYLQWGAVAKAKQLEQHHPILHNADAGAGAAAANIDLQSVMKAARTISGEIVLEKLLEKLIEIAVENAGAQKVVLLMQLEDEWHVVAQKQPNVKEVRVFDSIPWQQCKELSPMIIQYVSRLHEAVVLHDASQDDVFSKDPYIQNKQPKSILCLPILSQGRMMGILYLENNLMTHGFTADRLEVMNLLSSQIAVSMENAELYQRQVRLNQAYGRFVPHQFLRLLEKKSIVDVQVGDHVQMEMTVLFADIRQFTAMSERMTPEENFHFLNDFLQRMEPLIQQQGGFVDKYIGDSIMALFHKGADDAVRASVEMMRELRAFNQERAERGEEAIRIGIGTNSGHLMLGTIGGPDRMDSTVISDTVNLAARIEDLTKTYQVPVLISEHTYARLVEPERFAIRPIDRVVVRGKSEPVTLYEVFEADAEDVAEAKRAMASLFQQAYEAFWSNRLEEASQLFADCLRFDPKDSVVKMYVQRCSEGSLEVLERSIR